MKKFFKIGEISKLYHIGVDSIRYYEELGVIAPKRSEKGYRLYSMREIWKLNVIRELLELGLDMKTIKKYLELHNIDSTLHLLSEEKKIIKEKVKRLTELEKNIDMRIKTINKAQDAVLNKIFIKKYPERKCYMINEGYQDEHEMDVLIQKLLNKDKDHLFVIGNNRIGSVAKLIDNYDNIKYTSVFMINDKGTDLLPKGEYLSVSYKGEYTQSKYWIKKLYEYANENDLILKSNFLELLWLDIHTTEDVKEKVTELQVLVEHQAIN